MAAHSMYGAVSLKSKVRPHPPSLVSAATHPSHVYHARKRNSKPFSNVFVPSHLLYTLYFSISLRLFISLLQLEIS